MVAHFSGKRKELAENCDIENKEEMLIRDIFIINLIDPEIQKGAIETGILSSWPLTWISGCETSIKYKLTTKPLSRQR